MPVNGKRRGVEGGRGRESVILEGLADLLLPSSSELMEVEILEYDKAPHAAGDTIKFALRGVDNALANGLRRVMLAEVPTLAIDKVTVVENTSVFADEMIVHRLALTPLWSMHAKKLQFTKDCVCDGQGCHLCEVTGRIAMRCPTSEPNLKVYASDLIFDTDDVHTVGDGEKGVYLLMLGRAQSIDLRVYVRKGIGKLHAKWMPVGTVAMHFTPTIRLNNIALSRLSAEKKKAWVARCPRRVFEFDDIEAVVKVERPQECIYCKECVVAFPDVSEPLVVVKPKRSPEGLYDFIFTVESTGVLPVATIVFDAIDTLDAKLRNIQKALWESDATKRMPTRRIGIATTAPAVLNQDAPRYDDAEDNLLFVIQ